MGQGVFFFLLWPLFARAPRHWFLENFLLSAPGVQSVFVVVALRWAPRPFGGARAKKKNTTQGVLFLLRPRGKAGEGEAPCRHGARAKKKTPPRVFFFCSGPGERQGKEKPRWAPARGQSKKKKPWAAFFFLLRPRADAHSLTAGLGGDASPSPGWCLFFLLRGSPSPGWCLFFLLRGGAGPGWCFFFCCGPARTLTHSLWAGAISARPGWCFFFLLRPRRVFLDNNKKCLGYYIGSKKTRRGHSKKRKHHFRLHAGSDRVLSVSLKEFIGFLEKFRVSWKEFGWGILLDQSSST